MKIIPTVKKSLGIVVLGWLSISAIAKNVDVDIPYQKYVLDNGLRVIVHEDRKAPIVAVSVWYNVGSKDEPKGRTGFAHLFEHLMFNGSENYNDEYFKPFHQVGATGMNGTTWFDRTNYFQNVPTPALEMALWMESDRMGHLLGAIDQAKLDEQRGVVQNEKRQGDNQPYGKSEYRILEGLYPAGHPYRHSTIGSMDDLNAASLDDVKTWFKDYYGAANAVVVLAGDISPEKGRELVNKYFGDIPAGPEVTRMNAWIPTRQHNTLEEMYERVPQARIMKVWALPGRNEKETALLNLAARILGSGKNSRLYQELVYKNQLASNVSVDVEEHLLTSKFTVDVTLKPGADRQKAEAIMNRVLADFKKKAPSKDELLRAQTGIKAATIRGLEQVGGFNGKASILARGELYANDPGFFKKRLGWIADATTKSIQKVSNKWLADGFYQLAVLPYPEYKVAKSTVDRSKGLPQIGDLPQLKFPTVQRAKLKNGIEVVLAESNATPVVNVTLQFDAGYAADSSGFKLGTASYTMSMLDEGTDDKNALEISAEAEKLGANIYTSSNLDMSSVNLSALKSNLKDSVELFAEIVREPAFKQGEIDRLRGRWIAGIKQEKVQPVNIALRNLPPLIYGDKHAYGIPLTGSGTEESIQSLTREDLQKFYKTWLRPDNAKLFVVGDTKMDEILPILNRELGSWKAPKAALPTKNISDVLVAEKRVIVIDKPGAPQSLILAGELAPATGVDNNIAIQAMNDIIGGQFTSRVNMNLREDKHWAYGAYTFMFDARGQRPFMVYAPVQTDKTGASVKELVRELSEFNGDKPATQDEMFKTIKNNVNSLPGAYETSGAVMQSLLANDRFNRPDDYVAKLTDKYNNLKLPEIKAAAKQVINPDKLTWMIVGDKKEIVKQLKDMELGEMIFMDADGNVLK
ncbi:M16 family metallopeptidase [Aliikangiella coralliicola]|uniref:Insulinase family protein n=1 Tax=Aliikangiella coralliicola TaxID=2592383 RepID=A0A545UCG6_9GAMM|nr:pitrilysin family protein [Aliikangiella coralliicola]TQV87159.1 insulinase family protein [Aliikangiella coralliicola]